MNPETRAEDVAERAVQADEEVPDTIDGLNKEAKCTRPIFADPRSRGREPPVKISQELATLENAKESPSDLDAKLREQAWSCHCDQSTCCAMDHTNTMEPLWLSCVDWYEQPVRVTR